MIEVKILKNNIVTNKAQFSSQQEADLWVSEEASNGSFGLPERNELNEFGEATGNIIPAEYAVEIVDISAEIAAQNSKRESIEALNLGMDIMADIRTLNKAKISAQTLDFAALLADSTVANIERALWNGSLDTAKALINGLQSFYSAEEKAPIIAKIDAHIAKWS